MSDEAQERPRTGLRDLIRPSTLVGAVFLAIASSGAYDLLVKPGLTTFGQSVLNVVTFGSQTLKNSVYSSAAADPGPVTALLLLQLCLLVFSGLAGFMVAAVQTVDSNDKIDVRLAAISVKRPELSELEVLEEHRDKLKRMAKRLGWGLFATNALFLLGFVVLLTVHSQSVAVWRVFNQNIAILSPKLSGAQVLDLRADFAAMNTAEDFKKLNKKMHAVANSAGVALKEFSNWE